MYLIVPAPGLDLDVRHCEAIGAAAPAAIRALGEVDSRLGLRCQSALTIRAPPPIGDIEFWPAVIDNVISLAPREIEPDGAAGDAVASSGRGQPIAASVETRDVDVAQLRIVAARNLQANGTDSGRECGRDGQVLEISPIVGRLDANRSRRRAALDPWLAGENAWIWRRIIWIVERTFEAFGRVDG